MRLRCKRVREAHHAINIYCQPGASISLRAKNLEQSPAWSRSGADL